MAEELGAMVANVLSTKIAFEMNRTLYLQFAKAKNAIFKYHSTDIRYDFWGTGVVRGHCVIGPSGTLAIASNCVDINMRE